MPYEALWLLGERKLTTLWVHTLLHLEDYPVVCQK